MIIGILTDPGCGGTFIDWTINFLLGHPVADNPVQATNAHGHLPTSAFTKVKFHHWLEKVNRDQISTLYMCNFNEPDVTKIVKSYHLETAECVQKLQEMIDKIIVCSLDGDQKLYFSTKYASRKLHPKFENFNIDNASFDEQHDDYVNTFFRHSKDKFNDEIFDYREFLALNHNPWGWRSIMPNINTDKSFYCLDPWELYCNFDVEKLFSWLDLPIQTDRVDQWKTVYHKWKQIHAQRVKFATDFRLIVENILHGNHQDLLDYNLDILQEATIQHELIYTYNLNFKTWQLNKFENTYQLHHLLEPNTHSI